MSGFGPLLEKIELRVDQSGIRSLRYEVDLDLSMVCIVVPEEPA